MRVRWNPRLATTDGAGATPFQTGDDRFRKTSLRTGRTTAGDGDRWTGQHRRIGTNR
jgi:hypothetical protein